MDEADNIIVESFIFNIIYHSNFSIYSNISIFIVNLKILIKSDCKLLIDATLGYATCPWMVNAIVEDIKLSLEDYLHVSLCWVSWLANMTVHESIQWVFNVLRCGSDSISKVPSSIEVICNHEQVLI